MWEGNVCFKKYLLIFLLFFTCLSPIVHSVENQYQSKQDFENDDDFEVKSSYFNLGIGSGWTYYSKSYETHLKTLHPKKNIPIDVDLGFYFVPSSNRFILVGPSLGYTQQSYNINNSYVTINNQPASPGTTKMTKEYASIMMSLISFIEEYSSEGLFVRTDLGIAFQTITVKTSFNNGIFDIENESNAESGFNVRFGFGYQWKISKSYLAFLAYYRYFKINQMDIKMLNLSMNLLF